MSSTAKRVTCAMRGKVTSAKSLLGFGFVPLTEKTTRLFRLKGRSTFHLFYELVRELRNQNPINSYFPLLQVQIVLYNLRYVLVHFSREVACENQPRGVCNCFCVSFADVAIPPSCLSKNRS